MLKGTGFMVLGLLLIALLMGGCLRSEDEFHAQQYLEIRFTTIEEGAHVQIPGRLPQQFFDEISPCDGSEVTRLELVQNESGAQWFYDVVFEGAQLCLKADFRAEVDLNSGENSFYSSQNGTLEEYKTKTDCISEYLEEPMAIVVGWNSIHARPSIC